MSPSVTIRTEVNAGVATGHAVRCLALASALKKVGAGTVEILCEASDVIGSMAAALAIDHVAVAPGTYPDSSDDAQATAARGADVIVVDSPHLSAEWVSAARAGGSRVAYLAGPSGPGDMAADLCIWPDACPQIRFRSVPFRCGLEHTLLTPDYWSTRPRERTGDIRDVLVTTGGADHFDLCAMSVGVLDAVLRDPVSVTVIVGQFFKNRARIEAAAAASRHRVTLVDSPSGLKTFLEAADFVISGGGGTLYEMARLGLPGIGIAIWPIQGATVDALAALGTIRGLHWSNAEIMKSDLENAVACLGANGTERRAMAVRGPEVIDGQGAMRTAALLLEG